MIFTAFSFLRLIHCLFIIWGGNVRLYDSCRFPLESRCGEGTAIENEVIREEMKKFKNNRTAALSKLNKTFPCLFFACVSFYFVFYYKNFPRTKFATNQMQIRISWKFVKRGVADISFPPTSSPEQFKKIAFLL